MPAPNVTSVQGANLLKKSGSEAVLNLSLIHITEPTRT